MLMLLTTIPDFSLTLELGNLMNLRTIGDQLTPQKKKALIHSDPTMKLEDIQGRSCI